MNPNDYRRASIGERFLAFFANFFLYGFLTLATERIPQSVGLNESEYYNVGMFAFLLSIIVFCVYPESPGKRAVKLKILDSEKKEIELKKRILRASPLLALVFVLIIAGQTQPASFDERTILHSTVAIIALLIMLLILANGLAAIFNPTGLSLLDMRLGTQVMKKKPVEYPEHMKTWNRKIF